tara:strand:+ start:218 stop:415 length:198 start_codon:yes stop_codon:yes gene_type:complete
MKSETVKKLESQLVIPVEEGQSDVFAEDGTDLTQIRFMLAMTPTERVKYAQSLAQSIIRLRRGVK